MKIALIFFLFLCTGTYSAKAQVDIYETVGGNNVGSTVNGTVIFRTASANEDVEVYLKIANTSGSDKYFDIQRLKIVDVSVWQNETLVWMYGFEGGGYTGPFISPNPWTSPAWTSPLPATDTAFFSMSIHTISIDYMHYRYYVMEGSIKIDSVDIVVNQTLSFTNHLKVSSPIILFPNPSNDHLSILTLGYTGNLMVRITDLLGNLVGQTPISSESVMDVSNFKSGVYIISIYDDNKLLQSEQLVIKH